MRKNKYNELAATIMLITGLIGIVFGAVIQFLLNDTNDVLIYTINSIGGYMIWIGAVLSLLSMIIKISTISRNNTISKLKESGKLVYATNLSVWTNYYWGIDRKHWCYLYAEWENPDTHKMHKFRSDKLWINIEPIISEKKIDKIPVYIDDKNPNIYFVDVDSLDSTNNSALNAQPEKNTPAVFITILLVIILLYIFGLLSYINLAPSEPSIDTQIPDNNITNNEQLSPDISEESECAPFICYDGISEVESADLIPKANAINENLRTVLELIAIGDWDARTYTLKDIDKYSLYSLIANRFFDEEDYLALDLGINNAILSSKDFENIFEQITGIKNVKDYFKDYELEDINSFPSGDSFTEINNSKRYVFTEKNGETYYIIPFGVGMELGVYGAAVISDVTTQGDITRISIKSYNIDSDNDIYDCNSITTFEIETNGLKVYNFKVEKYN